MDLLGVWLVVALVAFALGLPAALLLREPGEGRVAALADSLTHGFVLMTLGMTLWVWLGVWGALVAVGGWLSIVLVTGLRRPWRFFPAASTPPLMWLALWSLVLLGAVLLRLHSVNFIPWTGDMGAYVNWANEFARTGEFNASWPPLFPAFLGFTAVVFGTANTTAAVGFSGVLFVVAVARLVQRLGAHRYVTLAVAGLAMAHQHAVWFSTFPVSESLNAPIFVVWLMLILSALRSSRSLLVPALVGLVVYGAALGLLRGSGPLLVLPLLVIVAVAGTIPTWRVHVGRLLLLTSANIVGAGVGYWYGVAEIRRYTVDMQMGKLLPGGLRSIVQNLGLLDPSLSLAATLVVTSALLAWWGWHRLEGSPKAPALAQPTEPAEPATHTSARWFLLTLAVLLVVGMTLDALVNAMVWHSALRMGPLLLVGVVAALAIAALTRSETWVQLYMALLGGIVLMFIGLHTLRLGIHRGHEFYLYWDRYLFSEVFPASLALSAIAATWALSTVRPRWATATALVAALGITVAAQVPSLILQSKATYLDGAYAMTRDLLAVDESGLPRIWSNTTGERPDGFFFPNTWMAYAVPLETSFGLTVMNADRSRDNFRPDEVLNAESLVSYLACAPGEQAIVHEAQVGGTPLAQRLSDPRVRFVALPPSSARVWTLNDPPTDGEWKTSTLRVENWRVELVDGSVPCNP